MKLVAINNYIFCDIMLLMQPKQTQTYYEQRRTEIFQLRFDDLWTYQMIAEKYGISKERVHQIIQTARRHKFYSSKTRINLKKYGKRPDLTNSELAELLGCETSTVCKIRKGMTHAMKNGVIKKAVSWQHWASSNLKEHGIDNILMSFHNPYNIITSNNLKINVIVAITPKHSPSIRNINPPWRFSIKKISKPNRCDFFMLIIAETEDVFIIPYDNMPNAHYISFCYPTARPLLFKWGKYHFAYDLLLT